MLMLPNIRLHLIMLSRLGKPIAQHDVAELNKAIEAIKEAERAETETATATETDTTPALVTA